MRHSSKLAAHQILLPGVIALALGCGDGAECSDFIYAPNAAVIVVRDQEGKKICDIDDVEVENSRYPKPSEAPEPGKRKSGVSPVTEAAAFNELCEIRVAGWYDEEARLSIEATLTVETEDVDYEPVELTFEFSNDECGRPQAKEQRVELTPEP